MTGKTRAAWSAALGLIAVVVVPAAIVASRYFESYDLLHAAFAIPLAVALGIGAVVLARRARALNQATLGSAGGARTARAGRLLGLLGLSVAASATIAVAVYGVLLAVD